jgi:hypothetical protein
MRCLPQFDRAMAGCRHGDLPWRADARRIGAVALRRRTTICREASAASQSSRGRSCCRRGGSSGGMGTDRDQLIRSRRGINLWVSGTAGPRSTTAEGSSVCRDTNVHGASRRPGARAFIAQGRVIIRVRVQDPGEATRIDTPNAPGRADASGTPIASTSRRIARRPRFSSARAKRTCARQ